MHHHQNLGDAAALNGMIPPYEAMAMYEQNQEDQDNEPGEECPVCQRHVFILFITFSW